MRSCAVQLGSRAFSDLLRQAVCLEMLVLQGFKIVLTIALLVPLILGEVDYYKILGVTKDANEKDLKSAYRQLSKKYHPDKNPNDESAHHKFIELGEAYEVLSDPDKRKTYDQFGADAVKNGGGGGPGGPGGPGGGFHDPFDLFEQMFGGGSGGGFGGFGGGGFQGFGGQGGNRKQRGQSIRVRSELSLKDYYKGGEVVFYLNLKDTCGHCRGSGSQDGKVQKCSDCGGRGIVVQVIRMGIVTQQVQHACGKCSGTGEVVKNKCKTCHGAKVQEVQKEIKVQFQAGCDRDFIAIKKGEADNGPNIEPGDIQVEFAEVSINNMGYRRRGNHLYRTEAISYQLAINGAWEREIEFLDPNKKINLSRPAKKSINNGDVEVMKGFGMPINGGKNGYGDLYIDYVVVMPIDNGFSRMKDEL